MHGFNYVAAFAVATFIYIGITAGQTGQATTQKTDAVVLRLTKDVELTLKRGDGENYFVSEVPISNAQYAPAVAAGTATQPSVPDDMANVVVPGGLPKGWPSKVAWSKGTPPKGTEGAAVMFVTAKQVAEYCAWLDRKCPEYHFRLPNVGEWLDAIGSARKDTDHTFGTAR